MPAFTHCQNPGCFNPLHSGRFNLKYCSVACRKQASNAREAMSRGARPGGPLRRTSAMVITETPAERAAWQARFASPDYAREIAESAPDAPIDPDLIGQPTPMETSDQVLERLYGLDIKKD